MANHKPQKNRGQSSRPKSVFQPEYELILERLKAARVASGLTQEQVAERLGAGHAYVSRAERGERRLDILELRNLLVVYEVDFVEFVAELENAYKARTNIGRR